MAELFAGNAIILWAAALAIALFFPVRQFIWVLSVRRAERDGRVDEARRKVLRKRAAVTAGFLVFVFSYLYTASLFEGRP